MRVGSTESSYLFAVPFFFLKKAWPFVVTCDFNLPANVEMADGASACGHPVLVGQERVELLIQTVSLMGQSERFQQETH